MDARAITAHRRVPVAAAGAAVAAPSSRSAAAAEHAGARFWRVRRQAEAAPTPRRSRKLELGQTHVADVRELGLDGEECASRPTFRGPRVWTAPTSAPNRTSAPTPPRRRGRLGSTQLTSGRETPSSSAGAHISEEATRVLVSATTAGGDAPGTLALLPPSEPPLFEQKFVANLDKYGGWRALAAWRTVIPVQWVVEGVPPSA